MKKALSLILAVMMLFGGMSLSVFAASENVGTTNITAVVPAKETGYTMVIPTGVAPITEAGTYLVGTPSVKYVENADEGTLITYTVTGTNFKCDGKKDLVASYYTDASATKPLSEEAITVYENNKLADPLTDIYVKVTDRDWNAAEAGVYNAALSFAFDRTERPHTVSFVMQGHGTQVSPIRVADGGKIPTPAADSPLIPQSDDGYVFTGWYKNAECTVSWNYEIDTVTADTVLYAQWKPCKTLREVLATADSFPSVTSEQQIIPGTAWVSNWDGKCFVLDNDLYLDIKGVGFYFGLDAKLAKEDDCYVLTEDTKIIRCYMKDNKLQSMECDFVCKDFHSAGDEIFTATFTAPEKAGQDEPLPSGFVFEKEEYYTVQSGDCLSVIAQKYGTSVGQLIKWNKIKDPPCLIYPGQTLRVK